MSSHSDATDCCKVLRAQLRPELFFALCEPTRLQLVCRLAQAPGPLTVTEISGCCGTHLSGVSRHLSILRSAGVVEASRQGREVLYRLATSRLADELRAVAAALDECQAARPQESES